MKQKSTPLIHSLDLAVKEGDIPLDAAHAIHSYWSKMAALGFSWRTVVYEDNYNIAMMHGMVTPYALDDIHDWMQSLENPEDEKFLVINSPGGDAFTGVALANALNRDGNTTVIVDGMAYSAASVAMQGAARRVMLRGSQQGIHKAWTLAIGNSEDLVNEAARLESMDTGMLEIYASKSTLDEATLAEMVNKDTMLDRKKAVEVGLADEAPDVNPIAGRRLPGQAMAEEKEAQAENNTMTGGEPLVEVHGEKPMDGEAKDQRDTAPKLANGKPYSSDWLHFIHC